MSTKKSALALPFTRRDAVAASLLSFAALPASAADCEEGAVSGPAFRRAVVAGEIEKVREYLGRDRALVWHRDEAGVPVAVLAFLAGHPEMVALFRENGLRLDLIETVMAADWEAVRRLLDPAPEQVHLLHPFGGNAMHAAAILGHGEKIFELQVYGGDANAPAEGGCGQTPLRLAFAGRDPRKVETTVASLLGNGADPNARQKDDDLPLHAAARMSSSYLVRTLLRKGADPEARNSRGEKALELAEKTGDAATIALLRQPRQVRRDHRTSRFAANLNGEPYAPPTIDLPRLRINRLVGAAHGNLDQVKAWVAERPELAFAISNQGEMAIEGSAHVGRKDLVQFFLDRGLPLSLPTAIIAGELARAKKLLAEDRLRINERGPHDFPLSFYPSFAGGSLEAAELLIENGVDLEAERLGTTALHLAARLGQAELVQRWLAAGADPTAKTRDESAATPLDLARKQGHTEVVAMLEKAS